MKTYSVLLLFAGLGGGALGFEALTGAPSVCADTASLTPEGLLAATGGRVRGGEELSRAIDELLTEEVL